MMRRTIMFMGLSALLYCTGCESKKETKEEKTQFLVTSPLKKDTLTTREYVCQIHSIQHIELRALESG
jgi:membrane fusion protein (multidrug efflux system)